MVTDLIRHCEDPPNPPLRDFIKATGKIARSSKKYSWIEALQEALKNVKLLNKLQQCSRERLFDVAGSAPAPHPVDVK
jgi:hypothetical protein